MDASRSVSPSVMGVGSVEVTVVPELAAESIPSTVAAWHSGLLIGRGVSSEVYAWTADTVVKLFKPQFECLAAGEFERTRAINAADAPCPAVHGTVEVEGRTGLILDRLSGPSLLAERGSVSTLAHIHASLHDLSPPTLPQLADTMTSWGIGGVVCPGYSDAV